MTVFTSLDILLLCLMVTTAVTVLVLRNLFATTMLLSLYSLLMALVWLNLDAVDVAFTEAAVGAGISTVLLLGAVMLVGAEEKPRSAVNWPAVLIVGLTAAALGYGTLDMPTVGDPSAPAHQYLAPEYIAQAVQKQNSEQRSASLVSAHASHSSSQAVQDAEHENYFHAHIPNLVTPVIVSYRGYDTLFEVTVIFTAGMSLILLLRQPEKSAQ